MWRTAVLAVVITSIASGCSWVRFSAPEKEEVEAPVPEVAAKKTVAIVVPTPREKPTVLPSLPTFDPQTLIGLGQSEVIAALGQPNAREEIAPARVWRYAAVDCEVKLFFYLDLRDEQFHLLSYETSEQANERNGDSDAAQRCLDQVRKGRPRNEAPQTTG